MSPTLLQLVAAAIFGLALLHTFSTKYFEHLAHARPTHAGVWHLLAEVEIVFGFWAMILMVVMSFMVGKSEALAYLDGRNFTEPLFVFAIMVVAGSRPVLQAASAAVQAIVRAIPLPRTIAFFLTVLAVVPLLGSFITEPAAMTLAALLMRDTIFAKASTRLKYAALGTLFVNISIGGTLTPYAAPPVLMVAKAWGFDLGYMLTHIGWKAAVAVLINAAGVTFLFARELRGLEHSSRSPYSGVPLSMVLGHLLFLLAIVLFAHHPAAFIAVFLLFMGVSTAYPAYQDRLMLREGLLVAFFLGGLVVLGGMQQWWLQPLLLLMGETQVFFGAVALTAITDNAALTYLGSLVEGLTPEFKYALLTGAVTGGGLTLIANAPNPAGASILKGTFDQGAIAAHGLFAGALGPTLVAILCFRLFPL
ncbi:putative Na+/H+ antiporter [Malikia sp.]|uniref:putative Na+/H+ antiporter n=1 Tax=Malikia sp. TaxID=2070706 RepID=UPI002626752F|nr:putative Na+/H+ antiporter [Malikia sp.]MDD2729665.1 putative Na+/H+ antiporter [Malikia sp.]